jgi:hypothetical protein
MKPFAGRIGASRADITPPVGIYARNWGAAAHDVAEGIHRPLTLNVLTLQEGEDAPPFVLVSADLGWWRTRADETFVRGTILEELALDPARLMICLTHTHAGPSLCREDAEKPGGYLIADYLDSLIVAVVNCTRHALETAEPALLEWAVGACGLATNRDLPDPDGGRYINGWNAEAPADQTLTVGRVTTQDGRILATIVHYACHPTTLAWDNRLISPDYIGAMREIVERDTGSAPCLFLLGACGELAPAEQYTGDTAVADRHGRQLGYAALATLEGMLPPGTHLTYRGVVESGAPLAVWQPEPQEPAASLDAIQVEVEMPLQALPSLAELDALLEQTEDRAMAERLRRKRRIRQSVGEGDATSVPLWAWRIGDAFLVGCPNEAYSRMQTELRERFAGHIALAINVVNGHFGYLPPAELYTQNIYQVWQTPFAAGCLERTTSAAVDVLRNWSD